MLFVIIAFPSFAFAEIALIFLEMACGVGQMEAWLVDWGHMGTGRNGNMVLIRVANFDDLWSDGQINRRIEGGEHSEAIDVEGLAPLVNADEGLLHVSGPE